MPETVLTISALDLGLDRTTNYMARICQRYATTNGRKQIQVPHPAKLDPTGNGSIAKGVESLNKLIRQTRGYKTVLAYSQGAQIAGAWMRKYAHAADAPPPEELFFILIGNPERKYGKQPWTVKTTPDYTQYRVRDVTRRGDNWADYQGWPKSRFAAMFGATHNNYWNTNIYDPRAEVIKTAGNTTYVRVP